MQRKLSFFIGLLILSLLANSAFGQGFDVQFTQDRSDVFTLDVNLDKYDIQIVQKEGQTFSKLKFGGDINLSKAGWAELPFVSIPVQLSPDRNVDVEIIESSYVDISLVEPMLPSRGVLYRNQDPSEIPYEIDPESIVDEWYPQEIVEDGEPYVLRKVRGQNIRVQPFRYNAVEQTLRVYTQMRIRVSENTEEPVNPLPASLSEVNIEMAPVYRSVFLNYNQNTSRWAEEIGEFGDVLVIYTSRDVTVIQPWIEWKQQKGYNVDELQVATGTNVGTDIQSAYNANSNLLYVLLVGDWAEIKSDLGGSETTPMDPMLGCVAGTDDHHDIIIGRFSAESTADVTAQVNKTIEYERDVVSSDTWYKNALGIASDQGDGSGDDGEADYDQINNIHDGRLLPTTYT
ncbi:MAG: C25 family peptidase propeptide domain-containing protein, partial [Bacteroidota bacterium]|nr:C25 family peptidase propeptide domain-containing protein [Bacteroidota bacterium]